MISDSAIIYEGSLVDPTSIIEAYAIIGYIGLEIELKTHHHGLKTVIKADATVEPHCIVYSGATLERDVHLDPYCRVGRNSFVGARTQVLYGARVHDDVTIGDDCIIAGNVSNRVQIGNRVRHHGRLAHRYNRPNSGWHAIEEPSMSIGNDVVIGMDAILIGDITIGDHVYIAAGEIVRESIPPYSIFYKGEIRSADDWNGSLKDSDFWS